MIPGFITVRPAKAKKGSKAKPFVSAAEKKESKAAGIAKGIETRRRNLEAKKALAASKTKPAPKKKTSKEDPEVLTDDETSPPTSPPSSEGTASKKRKR